MAMLSAVFKAGHTLTVDVSLLAASREVMADHVADERGVCRVCDGEVPCRPQVFARRRLVQVGELP